MPKVILKAKPSRKLGEHYVANAAVVWCFDDGWRPVLVRLVKARGYKRVDEIKCAGGAKTLGPRGDEVDREFVLRQILVSIEVHATRRIILMTHSDCGAYGGLKAFENDPKIERKQHAKYLRAAKKFLRGKLPRSVKVETVFADFEGLQKA